MKIVVIVRTKNESRNIERFCMNYQWADQILVADGLSCDDTIHIARKMPKTKVKLFTEVEALDNFLWRTPQDKHINYLIKWAKEEKADWIILDDCDCFPNYKVKENAREILESTTFPYVFITRLYLWGTTQHFRKLAQPASKGVYCPSLWAWKADTELWANREDMGYTIRPKIPQENVLNLMPPYCLLHNPWPTEEVLAQKLHYYRQSGLSPKMLHPKDKDFGGRLEDLPEWAKE